MAKCDLTYLKSISPGNNDFLKQIVTLFLTDTPVSLTNMQIAAKDLDWDKVHHYTHKIKPSVELMGLPKDVVEILFLINDNSKNQVNIEGIPLLVNDFVLKMNEILEDLKLTDF